MTQTTQHSVAARRITFRTRGHGHGPITRLMSPSDLGQRLKPFVFLDIFEFDRAMLQAVAQGGGMPLHPHSGIATVTVITEGRLRFDDPAAGTGTIGYGGVEWMRASGGVWHGKEMSPEPGVSRVKGFQLWLALPPDLENGEPVSCYLEASRMQAAGPAHVILGSHEGVSSSVQAPAGINYLLVTLQPGERWMYQPASGCTVGWLAVASGQLDAGEPISAGEMVSFDLSEGSITVRAGGEQNAVFVLGSAIPHQHDLHLGSYSVHTSARALALGEQRITELRLQLNSAGDRRTNAGTLPVFK